VAYIDQGRMRALAWPAGPIRPYLSGVGFLLYQLEEQIDSRRRRRKMGPCPKSSINRWRASITADRTMRKGSAQETRGLGQATAVGTVRWAKIRRGRIPSRGSGEAHCVSIC